MSADRLNGLTEGVFAVVLTLMLLRLIDQVTSQGFNPDDMGGSLLVLWPNFVAYFISFFVVGATWIASNLHEVRRVDLPYLWIRTVYLLAVTFISFSATLIGEYPRHWESEVLYGVNMLATYITAWWSMRYATTHGLVKDDADNREVVDNSAKFVVAAMLAYAVGPILSIWNPMWSFIYFMAVAVILAVAMTFGAVFERAPAPDRDQRP
jgi:uncharacterized membrane protein